MSSRPHAAAAAAADGAACSGGLGLLSLLVCMHSVAVVILYEMLPSPEQRSSSSSSPPSFLACPLIEFSHSHITPHTHTGTYVRPTTFFLSSSCLSLGSSILFLCSASKTSTGASKEGGGSYVCSDSHASSASLQCDHQEQYQQQHRLLREEEELMYTPERF